MAVKIPFQKTLDFTYGKVDQLSPLVRRIIANNPNPFTLFGTGTYLVGRGKVAVIDPGPADQKHIDAILAATKAEVITHIFITHTHIDHSPGCALLQQHTDAPSYAYARHGLGRLRDDSDFGADWNFIPDTLLADGQSTVSDTWSLEGLFTPGHAANHLSFYLPQERALFCGDAVMGWSTTLVSPPDGNMVDYMKTLNRLLVRDDVVYYPTHGAPIQSPAPYVQVLYQHRLEREQQVIDCVASGLCTVEAMLPVIYHELDRAMYPAAQRSLMATIECLLERQQLVARIVDNEEQFCSS